jgi:YggT family protein
MIVMLLYYLLELLKWLIIARALMSWFVSPYSDNPVVRLVRKVTDPILRPLAEVVPPLGGMDISPLLAFFAIQLTQMMLVRL